MTNPKNPKPEDEQPNDETDDSSATQIPDEGDRLMSSLDAHGLLADENAPALGDGEVGDPDWIPDGVVIDEDHWQDTSHHDTSAAAADDGALKIELEDGSPEKTDEHLVDTDAAFEAMKENGTRVIKPDHTQANAIAEAARRRQRHGRTAEHIAAHTVPPAQSLAEAAGEPPPMTLEDAVAKQELPEKHWGAVIDDPDAKAEAEALDDARAKLSSLTALLNAPELHAIIRKKKTKLQWETTGQREKNPDRYQQLVAGNEAAIAAYLEQLRAVDPAISVDWLNLL